MKKFYSLLLIMSVASAHAQYLPLKDFEDASVTSGGWTTQVEVGTDDWAPYFFGGNNFGRITNYDGSSNNPSEAWLISPSIDLSGATSPELTFINAYDYPGAPLELYVSTNYSGTGSPTAATWTPLSFTLSSGGFNWVNSGAVDLSGYLMSGVYIAFRYTGSGTDGSTWEVDDILVDEPAPPPSMVSIYDIQYTTASPANSSYMGQTVMTTGVVTAVAGSGYWLQDGTGAWNGVYVYDGTNTPNEGDSLVLECDVDEYNGHTELENITSYTVASTGNALPMATDITTDTNSAEQYEGVLVRAGWANCTNDNAGFGQWIINDGSGDLFIDDLIYSYTASIGTQYRVTGPLYYAFDEWKVEPRDVSDVEIGSGVAEWGTTNIDIYPNPASNEVTLNVDNEQVGGTINIYGTDGRLVMKETVTGTQMTLSISELENGIYTVVIEDERLLVTGRLLKQ